jgi:hypothetical protein
MLIAVADRDIIDPELRLIAAVRQVCRWHGGPGAPSDRLTNCSTNATS